MYECTFPAVRRPIFRPVRDPIAWCLPQEIGPCSADAASATGGKTNRDVECYADKCAAGPVRAISLEHPERHRREHRAVLEQSLPRELEALSPRNRRPTR